MADIKTPTDADRLACVRSICNELAIGINNARLALRSDGDNANTAHLVADALERLGWMSERASVLAGCDLPRHVGDADDWMLPDSACAKALAIERGAGHV